MSEVNCDEWAVPPMYICNATQHDLTKACNYISAKQPPRTFQPFEITSFCWGSKLVGYWRSDCWLSDAMEMSGAATSGTTGRHPAVLVDALLCW